MHILSWREHLLAALPSATSLQTESSSKHEKYGNFVDARREWAYETDHEFARFPLSREFQEEPFKKKNNVEYWRKL